ncbi:pilus assembly protein [Arthrobacter sp. ISL-30]|nr:pilus assembly protein [Arthrobacter sp. ISL-30]
MLAVVGSLLLVSYVQGAEARAQKDLAPVEVLVVQAQVPEGADLEKVRAATQVKTLPAASVPNGALKNLDGQDGKVTSVALMPGEVVLGGRLVEPSSLAAPGSVPVPEGMQEVSVQLDAQRVVGGRLSAGDTVGIVLMAEGTDGAQTAQQVFHQVLVTSVQRAESKSTNGTAEQQDPTAKANTQLPTGAFIVTFARTDIDAAKIAFAAKYGDLWLTKEPATATVSGPLVIKNAELFR